MAISKVVDHHKLLNSWASRMDEDIWHFNQVDGLAAPLEPGERVYIQSEREIIARELRSAWDKIVDTLNYFPRPTYFVEDRIDVQSGIPWWRQPLRLRYGKWIAFGERATSVVSAGAVIAYSDSGIGVNDTATITVAAGTLTDPTEIHAFFTTTDGAPGAADDRWEIEPLTVTYVAPNFILTGHRALFVKPTTIWNVPFDPQDPNARERNDADTQTVAHFVTAVDVYRVFTGTTNRLQALAWDGSVQMTSAGVIYDPETSTFLFDDGTCTFTSSACKMVTHIKAYYLSGLALEYGAMDSQLEEALIRLANTTMPSQIDNTASPVHARWTEDRSIQMDARGNALASPEKLNNPFGITFGAMWAYGVTVDRARGRGGKLFR